MTTEVFGEGNANTFDWITPEIVYLLRRAKEDLPPDYVLETIEKQHGLILFVDTDMFDRYPVEVKIRIAMRMNQLKDEIESKGCPTWVEKGRRPR